MNTKNTPLIVANWKMNHNVSSSEDFLKIFLSHQHQENIVICPPLTLLESIGKSLKKTNISLGAQDCSQLSSDIGAFTGDISSRMLKDAGCKYVILGHSERRKYHLETNNIIKQKISNAHQAGLIAILCIGENLDDRQQNTYIKKIEQDLEECLPSSANSLNTIIAYEPVWAIGTGKTASNLEIEEIHKFLAKKLEDLFIKSSQTFEQNAKIIYGGSVNEKNSASILAINNVSGLLIGGASLDAEKFYQIIQSANI